jgi:hypothetical protein
MTPKRKILTWLVVLMLADVVIPVPITGLTLLYVVLERPPWFLRLVNRVYRQDASPSGGGS